MHDLKANFDKISPIIKNTLADQLNKDDNLEHYSRKPALSDADIISFSLLQEALGIDSERWFWRKLHHDYDHDFNNLPHLSNYNRRRKRLATYTEQLAGLWGNQMSLGEDTYLVDSIPVPVAHVARGHTASVCREHYHTAPDKGYNAVKGQYYLGYKLHLVISLSGVYHSMELTKASIHDVHYLKEIKYSGLNHCLLLADKGYQPACKPTCLKAGASNYKRPWGEVKKISVRGQKCLKPLDDASKHHSHNCVIKWWVNEIMQSHLPDSEQELLAK